MSNIAQDPRDRHTLTNTIGISAAELIWGLGMPVVIESTFLQLFIRQLGGSSLVIGLIPAFYSLGTSVFPLLAVYLTAHRRRKRASLILVHIIAGAPIFLFGIVFWWLGPAPGVLGSFFAAYGCFSIGIGLVLPVWQNYIVKIFSEARVFRALSMMAIGQSVGKLASSFLLAEVVRRSAFSARASSLTFTAVGLVFILGSFMFLLTREPEEPPESDGRRSSRLAGLLAMARSVLRNRNFLRFLGGDLEGFALIGVISFYAIYATEYCGVSPSAAAGLFVAASYLGGVAANVLLGWVGLLELKGKLIATRLSSLAAIGILLAFGSLPGFLLASFLLGCSRGTRMLSFPTAVKRLSGLVDATHYFAVAPLILLPVSTGIPILNGRILDHFAYLGGASYRILFAAMGLLVLASLGFILTTRFGPGGAGAEPPARRPGTIAGQAAGGRTSAGAEASGDPAGDGQTAGSRTGSRHAASGRTAGGS
jgi:hypothetical protein